MSESLLLEAARRLAAAGVDSPRLDARVLLRHAEGDEVLFEAYVARRVAREPLAYITGQKEFLSLDFEVGPGVLVPRPETETVIEQALAALPDRKAPLAILDLGTGTGCLLVALLKEFPNTRGLGLDISEEAQSVARRNVVRHDLTARCEIRGGDWANADGVYDVVVSNPPYVRTADLAGLAPEIVRFEPAVALDGGPDGLAAYRTLAPALARLVSPGGWSFVEIGAGQGEEVTAIFAAAGLEIVAIGPDLAGIPRVMVSRGPVQPGRGEKRVGNPAANR